ncbi:MAG: response regulator, partial [Candidatus Kapaibacterium sp.]
AKNGEQAVNICLNSPEVKIVFMDIKMPKLDGLSATKRIKAVRPDVIIIAQTAYALNSEKAELLREGCDDYISKPIDMDLFIKIVKKYLNLNE